MPSCEKCWKDAYDPYSNISQAERYRQLIEERNDNPCSPKEQAGQFWDEEKQIDTRLENKA